MSSRFSKNLGGAPSPWQAVSMGLTDIAFRHPKLSFSIKPTSKHLLLEQLHCKQGWTHSKPSYFLLIFVCTLITAIFRVLSAMDLCKGCLGSFFFGFSHRVPQTWPPFLMYSVQRFGFLLSLYSPANFWMADLTENQMERKKSQGDRHLLSTYVIEFSLIIVDYYTNFLQFFSPLFLIYIACLFFH